MTVLPDDIKPTVIVIDDDQAVRDSLAVLFQSVGLDSELFASVQEYLNGKCESRPGCMLLDVRLPGKSGLDFQSEILTASDRLPIIFITGYGDIPMTVRAMKAGAVEFLTKPFHEQQLLDTVNAAIALDKNQRQIQWSQKSLNASFETLTARERSIMSHVVNGLMNKQIAVELNLAEVTVKKYRGQIMRKMNANSLADLVKMSEKLSHI
jgi:FixJ family two-component response regulator